MKPYMMIVKDDENNTEAHFYDSYNKMCSDFQDVTVSLGFFAQCYEWGKTDTEDEWSGNSYSLIFE